MESITTQNKAVFRRYVSIWESGDLDQLSSVLASDYMGHPSSGSRGLDGLRERIRKFHTLYQDVRFIVEDQVAERDKVATRMSATATSSAGGKPVTLVGLNISRFKGGRIAEEWPAWETSR